MKLAELHEGEIKKRLGWLGKQIKKHGPGVAKAVGKAGLATVKKTAEIGAGALGGAAEGAYEGAAGKKKKK